MWTIGKGTGHLPFSIFWKGDERGCFHSVADAKFFLSWNCAMESVNQALHQCYDVYFQCNHAEWHRMALERVDELMDGEEDGSELLYLADKISKYEDVHFKI